MGKYEPVVEVHGEYGTAEVKHETPNANFTDIVTLGLNYSGDYVVKSPSGSSTHHKDLESAIERAERASGLK